MLMLIKMMLLGYYEVGSVLSGGEIAGIAVTLILLVLVLLVILMVVLQKIKPYFVSGKHYLLNYLYVGFSF